MFVVFLFIILIRDNETWGKNKNVQDFAKLANFLLTLYFDGPPTGFLDFK